LQGNRVVVTGASSGIGRAVALELARTGCKILATARRQDRLEHLAAQVEAMSATCVVVPGDLTSPDTRREILREAEQAWGAIDTLVNCAGVGAMGPFLEADDDRMRRIFEVNFFSAANLIRESYSLLSRGIQPVVVNVGSVLGHRAVPLKSEYCASKFALHGFTDSIRAEFRELGIDVLLVSPSTTDSEFFDSAIEDRLKRDWKGKRPMAPERVARIISRSIRLGKREVILSFGGKALVYLDRVAPDLADYLVTRFAK
jgi:short-subunit dehydrogenase